MKRSLSIFLLVFSFQTAHAFFLIEPYAGVIFGDSDLTETTSSTTYEHDAFEFGGEVGGRVGANLFGVIFGPVAGINISHMDASRDQGSNFFTGETGYDLSLKNTFWGGFVGYKSSSIPIQIWGEYYPEIHGTFTYADPESANPFGHEDKVKGNGFGLGLGWASGYFFAGLMYRQYKYDHITLAGQKYNLPNDTLNEYKINQFILQFGLVL